jgi:hypothetical protein
MNMIEKVARAINDAEGFGNGWQYYCKTAKAAIEAMREPTEEMKDKDNPCMNIYIHAYQEMIDVALNGE